MREQLESKAVERSCRWFERLLIFYPRAHREEYGPAILQLFRDQGREAWARGYLSYPIVSRKWPATAP